MSLHDLHATRRHIRAALTVMERETGARTRARRVLLAQALREMDRLYTEDIADELCRQREVSAGSYEQELEQFVNSEAHAAAREREARGAA